MTVRLRRNIAPLVCASMTLLLAACAGSGGPMGPSTALPQRVVSIVPDASALRPAGPLQAIVLYSEQFADPFHRFTTVTAVPAGGTASVSATNWSVSNDHFSVWTPNSTATPGVLAPTPPPGGATITGETPGAAIASATVGDVGASIPIYYYTSINAGCDLRATAAGSFDPGVTSVSPATKSDLYVTEPSPGNPGDSCSYDGLTEPGATTSTLHVPYGGTLATDGDDASRPVAAGAQRAPDFPYLPGSIWRNDFTSLSWPAFAATAQPCSGVGSCQTIGGSVLVFKTAQGRIVKLKIVTFENHSIIGPYEVSGPDGTFPY